MVRRAILSVVVLASGLNVFLSVCSGASHEETIAEPAASTDTAFDPNTGPILVAWWKLDGDTADSVGGHSGTPVGSLAYGPGKSGQALNLDGTSGVSFGKTDALDFGAGDWAVSAWIKTTQTGIESTGKGTIFANGGDELQGIRYTLAVNELESGKVTLTTDDDRMKMQATGQTTVNDGAWHHVVGTREGGTLRVYVDGVLNEACHLPGEHNLSGASRQGAYIGAITDSRDGSLYKHFTGQVDDVCVFACALGDADVKALYSGTDPTALASRISERPPAKATDPRSEPSLPPVASVDAIASAAKPARTTGWRWLAGMAVLAGIALVLWAWRSRSRYAVGNGAGGALRRLTPGVPGMTWTIAWKEFLLSLMTFKFAVGTAVSVVLMAVFMPGLVNDYEERLENYNGNVAANEAEFQKVKVYNNLTPTVYRAPTVLSVFSKGIVDRLENSERIDLDQVSSSETGVGEANPLLSVFPAMDVTLILKIVVSVLALLMAYDVISGEREQGTLRLILSNTTPRHQVLLSKLLAGWMILAVTVTAAFLVGLLVLLMSRSIRLAGADWLRIALMYLVSLIFVGAMFNLGLLLSSVCRNSAVSLVLALFLWLVFAAILPNASAHIAAQLRPIESPEHFAAQLKAITNQRDQEIAELTRDIQEGEGSSRSDGVGAFGNGLLVFANKPFMDYLRQVYPITEPCKIQCIDKLLDVKAAYLSSLMRQKQLADTLAGITPVVLCERLMSTLAGTGFDNFGSFKARVRVYRHEVADYVRDKTDNFTATSYFTPCKEGDQERFMDMYFKPYNEAQDKAVKAKLYETALQKYQQAATEFPTLALNDFPEFTYRSQSLTVTWQQAIGAVGLLIFEGALFFALSFAAFLRYDVR